MKRTLYALALTFAVVAPAFAEDAKSIAQRLDDQWVAATRGDDGIGDDRSGRVEQVVAGGLALLRHESLYPLILRA